MKEVAGRLLVLLACASLTAACGEALEGPVEVAVLAWNADGSGYRLRPRTLETLSSLHEVRGEAATLVGGAHLVVDYQELAVEEQAGRLQGLEDLRRIISKDAGAPPSASFTEGVVEGRRVLIADDFDSLGMITSYAHLERARTVALGLGVPEHCLRGIPTYYDVDFTMTNGGGWDPQSDNAAYFPLMQAFLVMPFEVFQEVPMAMNPGIMAHEYAHGIFNCLVADEDPASRLEWMLDPAGWAYFYGVNEGLADFFGAVASGDPDFLSASIPEAHRDLRVQRTYTQPMDDDAQDGETYDPYALGSVLASALWRLGEELGSAEEAGRGVIASLPRLRERAVQRISSGEPFLLRDYLEVLVAALGEVAPDAVPRMCRLASERFALAGPVPGCGA